MHWTALLARRAFRSARVVEDLPCAGCGYNLRGLLASGRCPECGHAVADALFLLREPETVAASLQALAYSYMTLIGWPIATVAVATGSRGLLWVGLGLAAVGSGVRAVALPDLLRRGGLAHLPVIGAHVRTALVLALAEAGLAAAALVAAFLAIRSPTGVLLGGAALVVLGWPVVLLIAMLQLSRLAGMVADLLDYAFVAVELRVHRLLILGGLAVLGLLLLASAPLAAPASGVVGWTGVAAGGLIVAVGMGFLIVGLLHAAGAAQRATEARDDVLEHEGGEVEQALPAAPLRRAALPDIELSPEKNLATEQQRARREAE